MIHTFVRSYSFVFYPKTFTEYLRYTKKSGRYNLPQNTFNVIIIIIIIILSFLHKYLLITTLVGIEIQ